MIKNVKEQFNSNLSRIDRIFFSLAKNYQPRIQRTFWLERVTQRSSLEHDIQSVASLGNSYRWLIKEMSVRKPSYSIWVNIFLWSKSEVLYWKICAILSQQIGNCPTPLRKLVGIQLVWLVFFFNLKQQLTIWY